MNFSVVVLVGLLAGWKAETAAVELPVPKGWRFNPNVFKPSPDVPAKGGSCRNAIWFDFIPGATLEYAKQLIETESIDVTAAIRRWDPKDFVDVVLAQHPAVVFRVELRSVYIIPFEAGVLIAQTMANGEGPAACLPLQDEVAARLVELFFAPSVQEKAKRIARTEKPPPLRPVQPVPHTLTEALEMLETSIDAKTLAELRASEDETTMFQFHHGLGQGLRNGWGLWGRSPLAKFFHAMGVFHPDDMSGILVTSFWRKLHHRPLEVEAQARAARRYWDLRAAPVTPVLCPKGGPAKSLFGLEAPDRYIHIYACGRSTVHAYEMDVGWYAPDATMKKRIESLRAYGALESAPLKP
jgi:hypothetical protein